MGIEIIDGFEIIPNENGNLLGIESNRLDECMEYAVKKGITKIFIHVGVKYNLKDINFLKPYTFITHITLSQNLINIDISGVHQLRKLKYLSLSNNNQGIDFSFFPDLEEASIDWNNKLVNLSTCKKLKKLIIWKYKPKSKNFIGLNGLDDLKSLEITESNIESFSGIGNLKCLSCFEGSYLSKIESLIGIELLSKNLNTLILNNCKHLSGYTKSLSALENLEKLILTKCGEMDHLEFIKKMQKLKYFSFVNTIVIDGNLLPLKEKGLQFAGFDDKRHYSHTMKEITPSFSWHS